MAAMKKALKLQTKAITPAVLIVIGIGIVIAIVLLIIMQYEDSSISSAEMGCIFLTMTAIITGIVLGFAVLIMELADLTAGFTVAVKFGMKRKAYILSSLILHTGVLVVIAEFLFAVAFVFQKAVPGLSTFIENENMSIPVEIFWIIPLISIAIVIIGSILSALILKFGIVALAISYFAPLILIVLIPSLFDKFDINLFGNVTILIGVLAGLMVVGGFIWGMRSLMRTEVS